jgi:flagellum-specific peptidoglycan hydrolase FlgJ
MKHLTTFFLCSAFSLALHSQTYYQKYQPIADSLEAVYGIPSSIMLAVAMQESGGGKSKVAKLLNNHHGITGKNNLLKTHGIKSMYQWYPNDTASYEGFCKIVARRKFYTTLKGSTDYKKWVYAIAKSGYAGSNGTRWSAVIIGIIRNSKLN